MTVKPTRREKVEARERAILSAARAVFEASGYDRARVADIAKAIGAAEGTIYTYFPTKDALLDAVLDAFWTGLTQEAAAAVDGVDGAFPQLEALARRHLALCLDNFDFIALSIAAGAPRAEDTTTRTHMRTYVAVFDAAWRRGVDRGELRAEVPLWIVRDQFYGALEYSLRTLRLHSDRRGEEVVVQLMRSFQASYSAHSPAAPDLTARIARLEADRPATRPSRRYSAAMGRSAKGTT